jgi:hypothetical protein
VRGQTDKGDRRALAAAIARALEGRLAKFNHEKPATFFIGLRYAAHARAAAANTAGEHFRRVTSKTRLISTIKRLRCF